MTSMNNWGLSNVRGSEMSDMLKAVESRVSPADWQRMAKHAQIGPDELKAKVLKALQGHADGKDLAVARTFPVLSDATKKDSCHTQSFEISLFKIIGLSGSLTLCGDSSTDWSAELKVCLLLAGSEVWCTSYKFDPHNLGVCFEPSVGLAKARLCFNLELGVDKVCLHISGNACVWIFGWQCGDFDTTVFCLPLP